MGSLILCHEKKARRPYEITRIHKKIYTIEELCYYLCNNLYLIDYTLVNYQLCDWIAEELEMEDLAEELKNTLRKHGSVERFVLLILSGANIYTALELNQMKEMLRRLKNLKDVERQKHKADNLLQSGEAEAAILAYLSIIHGEYDETLDAKFYGRVYGCLGAAYGRLFLYEEASKNFEAAFQICEEESMLTAYIYSCYRYMNEDDYKTLLSKSEVYQGIDAVIQEKIKEQEGNAVKKTLTEYKDEYRREL